MMNPLHPRPAQRERDEYTSPYTTSQQTKRRKHSHQYSQPSFDASISPYSPHNGSFEHHAPTYWQPSSGVCSQEYARHAPSVLPPNIAQVLPPVSHHTPIDASARFSSFLHPQEADYIQPLYHAAHSGEYLAPIPFKFPADIQETAPDTSARHERSMSAEEHVKTLVKGDFKIPFAENANEFIPNIEVRRAMPKEGKRNGYVKFGAVIKPATTHPTAPQQVMTPRVGPKLVVEFEYTQNLLEVQQKEPRIALLPADFGHGVKMEADDRRLLNFYFEAWCNGRTILPGNSWKNDLGPMFSSNPMVRHALLSLAGIYVVDYIQSEDIRVRTNKHYAQAVKLLEQDYKDPEKQRGANGDALVAAITLLNMHDVVMWERRRTRDQVPRWLEGAQMGAEILAQTDPGCRYYKRKHVQISNARRSNTITIGRAKITALIVTPLDESASATEFNWLLSGSEKEVDRIHAACGYSPKLMHCLAHITHLAAKVHNNPQSRVILKLADGLDSKLDELRQWSEISPGHDSLHSLLASCVLDESGVVTDAASMTDLTAEAWRITAIIYLRCRVNRLPRRHPEVIKLAGCLSYIIRRMPCVGELFTAQAPFLPVWILGLLSTEPEHRAVADRWFNTVISATDCRSSVPPAWEALKKVRDWADEHLNDEGTLQSDTSSDSGSGSGSLITSPIVSPTLGQMPHDASFGYAGAPSIPNTFSYWPTQPQDRWAIFDQSSIGQRAPWWEEVVQHIIQTEGTLCLI